MWYSNNYGCKKFYSTGPGPTRYRVDSICWRTTQGPNVMNALWAIDNYEKFANVHELWSRTQISIKYFHSFQIQREMVMHTSHNGQQWPKAKTV
jgi:hypothetical protein